MRDKLLRCCPRMGKALPRMGTLLMMAWGLMSFGLYAQQTVTGSVSDAETGEAMAGVTITVKGTTAGALTRDDGSFNVRVPNDNAVLVFSFIGYETQEIAAGGRSNIDVSLAAADLAFDEVVITALGIEREKKALGYSVTEISGADFVEAREVNVGNSLAGKVAGVNVASPATGKAGSTRIIIRGNSSISGQNQPLFVVDGVPIDNSNLGSAGMWGGSDGGDGISSLNPDDIETLTVLKGGTAAALYGSRASNGVILITTKTGRKRKGIGVELNSNFVVDQLNVNTDYQNEYGHGNRGMKPANAAEALQFGLSSWGARLDGSSVPQFDGQSRPYSSVGDNLERFYRTGTTFTNTLALTGGNDMFNFRIAAANLDNDDIVPNAGLNRKTFTANVGGNFSEKFSARLTTSYIKEDVQNRPRLSDSPGNANYTVGSLPPSINVEDMQGDPNKLGADTDGTELQFNDNIFVTNPYWAAHQFFQNNQKDRILGSLLLRYEFTDWLYLQGRVGIDTYNRRTKSYTPYGTAYSGQGGINENINRFSETNTDFLLGARKTFDGGFGFDIFVGGNQMRRVNESVRASGGPLEVPFVHSLANVSTINGGVGFNEKGINSLYGSLELSYNNYLYLTFTGRQDWFSVLTAPNGASIETDNTEIYPSAGLSFVFSDALQLPEWFNFGKLRGSWARVANEGAVGPYQLTLPYGLVGGHIGRPLGRISGGTIPPISPTPPTVTELELGFDLRLFDNRVSIDFAYYDKVTEGDILGATISQASGYGGAFVSVGKMTNSGVELLLTASPVRNNDFRWDISFNLAKNNNVVDSLVEGLEDIRVFESRTRNAYIHHVVGLPYSQIMGFSYAVDDNGNRVYDANGLPQRGEFGPLGNGVHDLTMGVLNTISFKDLTLSFLIDVKTGGSIYTATNAYTYFRGLHKNTLEGREGGVPVNGVDADGNPVQTNAEAQDYYQRLAFNITEEFVQDADFAKLRQLTLGYRLPRSLMNSLPLSDVTFSLVGRNLLLLWSKTENVDPESTYTNGNAQGLEMFGVPATRSYGFNLNIKF